MYAGQTNPTVLKHMGFSTRGECRFPVTDWPTDPWLSNLSKSSDLQLVLNPIITGSTAIRPEGPSARSYMSDGKKVLMQMYRKGTSGESLTAIFCTDDSASVYATDKAHRGAVASILGTSSAHASAKHTAPAGSRLAHVARLHRRQCPWGTCHHSEKRPLGDADVYHDVPATSAHWGDVAVCL